ncbi:MAG: DNA alkylation repair protein [Anaerolineae bacterium]|nr:DNA alkylation repair protein [Anaerolineae bacterium]
MNESWDISQVETIAGAYDARIQALPKRNTPNIRAVRREFTSKLKAAPPEVVLGLAMTLVHQYGYRGDAYELLRYHKAAFESLTEAQIEALGEGIDSWWSVDGFARTISGPAWLEGLLGDETIHRWARSDNLWWRRAALVSTVALNVRSRGGYGDVDRTLAVCRMLADDHEDMVVKALSWTLRELVVHDPDAVWDFLATYHDVLAARVKREVNNKLETGLKNPRKST